MYDFLRSRTWLAGVFALMLALEAVLAPAAAAQGIRTLRDAELEAFLHRIMEPVFVAAGMPPSSIEFVIVDDASLNAFYAGGTTIFLHTGLILQTENVDQVIGVLAHETGHMTGGHVQRFDEIIAPASAISILGLVLAAAAIAAGAPDAGMGLLMGGQGAAQRTVLKFRRVQEASADQAAAQFLEGAGMSGEGLLEVFEKFRFDQTMRAPGLDPYVVSHPLSGDRIANLQDRFERSKFWGTRAPADQQEDFLRVKAKLEGYIYPAASTLGRYPESDRSVAARYARIYAWNKALEWDKALAEADSLIAQDPADPFFREIKGQILLENGRVAESLADLGKAAELAPDQPLILTLYGRALGALEQPKTDARAIEVLERAARLDPTNGFAWYQLAQIYTRGGNQALADLASAERFLLMRRPDRAATLASRAAEGLEKGTPKWFRAEDIRQIAGSAMLDGRRGR